MGSQRLGLGSGRPAPPRALRVLRGDRVSEGEPVPMGLPEPDPEWSPEVRGLWDRLAPDMIARGVLSVWDVPVFGELLGALVLAPKYRARMLAELGGAERQGVDAVYKYRSLMMLINAGAAQFGMTPAARSRIVSMLIVGAERPGRGGPPQPEDVLSS